MTISLFDDATPAPPPCAAYVAIDQSGNTWNVWAVPVDATPWVCIGHAQTQDAAEDIAGTAAETYNTPWHIVTWELTPSGDNAVIVPRGIQVSAAYQLSIKRDGYTASTAQVFWDALHCVATFVSPVAPVRLCAQITTTDITNAVLAYVHGHYTEGGTP